MTARWGSAALLVLAAAGVTPRAEAYVRSRTAGCHVVYWPRTCVAIEPDGDLYSEMAATDVTRIIQQALGSWQNLTTGAFLKLQYVAPHRPLEAGYDGTPIIKFRTGTWCRPPSDYDKQMGNNAPTCYDASAAAITTVYFVNKADDPSIDGKILDADIELNTINNRFYDADVAPEPAHPGRNLTDLWNTLTHELGHVQGLEHTCRISYNDGLPACTTDQNGATPPLCKDVPAGSDLAKTTMFATAPPRETLKRTPKADDVAGIVAGYPLASDPKLCSAAPYNSGGGGGGGGGGCAVSPGPSHAASGSLGAAGLGGVLLGISLLLARVARPRRPTDA